MSAFGTKQTKLVGRARSATDP